MGNTKLTQLAEITCSGFCRRCNTVHKLGSAGAVELCAELMQKLDLEKRIDFSVPTDKADPDLSTDYLFGDARGQMFGVMTYTDRQGKTGAAYGFSGQYNSRWEVAGWVAPIIDPAEFDTLTTTTEREIKRIGKEMELFPAGSEEYKKLSLNRKQMSRDLMQKIHAIYRIPSFSEETKILPEVAPSDKGIPTGTGDCCAPKLLSFAIKNNLTPRGIAEFYYGRENRSGTKQHKQYYSSCEDKCGLILGHMLCGLSSK
ncbi:hypothetical protein [Desulfovibrio gilichinskyi]|uniref:Uncharacterized protein n=1 Tax=Desulfovibrio gilichinskyi TaxID=1519643 RepID=A0A1X7DF48_9BACT|nr:hypothetical protein [Desulfovibrio gilichinskyi]SMF14353.1 hypothetical protein SAMN06295933_1812 [Desulfovibrio gilichinskyi]